MAAKLTLIALFVFLNGWFVAAEFALVKTRVSRVQALADQGDKRGKRLMAILEELDLYLSACQLGITIASLVLGWLAEPAFAALLEGAVVSLGWAEAGNPIVHLVAFGAGLTVVTILHMVLGEQAPKVWAIDAAERAALKMALPLRIYTVVFKPLIVLVNGMSNALLRVLGIRGGHGEHDTDVRELKAIIGAAASAGNISSRQRMFAENILDLVELEVRHIMVPRTEVAFLDYGAPLQENLDRLKAKGHSRWPLCDGDLDSIRGIVLVRDVLEHLLERPQEELDLDAIARPPLMVPDTQPLSRFIVECQQTGHQGAMVLDEHGTVVGMVFLEDALEEIVGPLHDERDVAQKPYERFEDGSIEMEGSLDLPEASDVLGVEIDDVADTIGGFIIHELGRLPRRGDTVTVAGRYTATVLRTGRQRRIERLRFEPIREPDGDDG